MILLNTDKSANDEIKYTHNKCVKEKLYIHIVFFFSPTSNADDSVRNTTNIWYHSYVEANFKKIQMNLFTK